MTELRNRLKEKVIKIQSENCTNITETETNIDIGDVVKAVKTEMAAQIGLELLENDLIKFSETSDGMRGKITRAEFQFIEKDAIIEILNEMNL